MLLKEIEQIIAYLKPLRRYDKLIDLFNTHKNRGYAFELYFAYAMEQKGVKLEYEKRANVNNDKTVDFYHAFQGNNIWFELVSLDTSDVIKNDIEQQHKNTQSGGVSYHSLVIKSDHPNPHYDSAAQLIRLQEKILEKPEKFSTPSDDTFNIIVTDCSQIHLGAFDAEDFRNAIYGYPKDMRLREVFKGQRVKGLFEDGLDKRNISELQNKTSALICLGRVKLDLFTKERAYISCNPLLGAHHYHKTYDCLAELAPLKTARYIKPIKPSPNNGE